MIRFVPAYLDPSSGSIAYQVTLSGALALAAACRLYWHKLKRIFRRKRDAPDSRFTPGA